MNVADVVEAAGALGPVVAKSLKITAFVAVMMALGW